jgi:uncharacterized membrane protein
MKLPLASLLLAYAIFLSCLVATARELPGHLATHFGINGRANGWMDRGAYLGCTVGLALAVPLFMVGVTAVTGRLGRGMNIPNRDYWLAEERRQATIAVVMRFVVGLGALVVLLITAVHLMVVDSNNGSAPPRLSAGVWWVLGGFLAAVAIWSWMLARRFSLPK